MKWKVKDEIEYLYVPADRVALYSQAKLYRGTILSIKGGSIRINWEDNAGTETYSLNSPVVKGLVPRGTTDIDKDPNLSFRLSKLEKKY